MVLRFLWRAFKARYRNEKAEISALVASIAPGDIAVDVGTNKGSYLFWLSRAVAHGKVVAFEPQPLLAEYLRAACAATGLGNITVEAAGVSDSIGRLVLHVPGDTDSPSASFEHAVASREKCRRIEVPVHTLDDYFASRTGRIAAIKIDVEGHEMSVLRGATKILSEDRPCLVLECESRHLTQGTVRDVLGYVQSLGYKGYFVHHGKIRPLDEFDPAIHQKMTGERFWDSKEYCNNFILRMVD
jgi:FkbM family methyltransferase